MLFLLNLRIQAACICAITLVYRQLELLTRNLHFYLTIAYKIV